MIETALTLRCDNCKQLFDENVDRAFDGAIFTRGEVRKIARAEGWKRIEDNDYCTACLASVTKRRAVKNPS